MLQEGGPAQTCWLRCAGSREGGDRERRRGHCRSVSPPRLRGAVVDVTTGEGVRLRAGPLQSAVLEGQMSSARGTLGLRSSDFQPPRDLSAPLFSAKSAPPSFKVGRARTVLASSLPYLPTPLRLSPPPCTMPDQFLRVSCPNPGGRAVASPPPDTVTPSTLPRVSPWAE